MKLINNFKSPNFDNRKNKISFIIIHYTALKDSKEAISYLCDPGKKVSSHFLISQTGNIFQLVHENKRAWHAGVSYWDGKIDINSMSIGIELDFSKNKNNNKYSKKMIKSLITLIKKLKHKYNIKETNILGHSDVAPFRKIDPGPKFPWQKLYDRNLVLLPFKNNNFNNINLKKWFLKNKITSKKKIISFILSYIGYDTSKIINNSRNYKKLIHAYQSHYVQKNVSGKIDVKTLNLIMRHFINYVLTINKNKLKL